MGETGIKPFLCDTIDKSLVRIEWEKWFRSFSLYLESEEIKNVNKKKNKLLHLGGPQLQEVIYNIPGALDCPTGGDVFGVLVSKLNEYFSPRRNSTFERHLFRTIKPEEGESLNKFLIRIRHQAAKCSFGATKQEILDINVKDKLIDVWAPGELRKRLLEKEYSLDNIVEMCQIHEQIKFQTEIMIPSTSASAINKISSTIDKNSEKKRECFRCGRTDHLADSKNCPAKNSKCNRCGALGHFARKCQTKIEKRKNTFVENSTFKRRRFEPSKIRFVEENLNCKDLNEQKSLHSDCFQVTNKEHEDMSEFIDCFIGGVKISMLIDSGSRYNLIGESDWKVLCQTAIILGNVRTETENQFRTYAGNTNLQVKFVFEAPIHVSNQKELIASFYVIANGRQSLLGRETALRLQVLKLGLTINQLEDSQPFPKIKDIKVHLSIDKSVKPVQQPLRRIPSALEEKVELKLNEAARQDIIEPVNGPSSWISPIVIVSKQCGDIRLCIDMRRANTAILRENFPLPTFDSFLTKLKGAKYFSRLDLKNAYHQLELDEDSRDDIIIFG
ncbi:uncharacterized protein K02A2.6-like [Episyrphus balteatus]|uniref:uncharacterized protein K02A2.6-like n=1 Tax=Episyrphus balteatus TaxID=286459 RepID=UPI002485B097|nr:uncharacterized protein K02A2.6-like [Episyrphus balteatus]